MGFKSFLFQTGIGLITFTFGLTFFGIWHFSENWLAQKLPVEHIDAIAKTIEVVPTPPIFKTFQEITEKTEQRIPNKKNLIADGFYSHEGKLPKDFKDLESFEFWTKEYTAENNYKGVPITPKGVLLTTESHPFSKLFLGENKISFSTKKVKGFSFEFSGEFKSVKNPKIPNHPLLIIKGVLIKKKNDNKLAETKIRAHYLGRC